MRKRPLVAEGTDFELEQRTVIAIACHQQFRSAGNYPGDGESESAGFGSGIGEANLFDGRHTIDDQCGETALRFVGGSPAGPVADLLSHCLDNGRISVSVDHRRIVVDQIKVLVAVDIPEVRAFTTLDRQGIGLPERSLTRGATWHEFARACVVTGAGSGTLKIGCMNRRCHVRHFTSCRL